MNEAKKDKISLAARSVFLKYGYKRTNMSDIAEAAGISRAALYLVFENKEDVFIGVYQQWLEETLIEVKSAMATTATPHEKLEKAFEIWAVRPFEMAFASPEAQDLIECTQEFAQNSMRQGYSRFESTILPTLLSLAKDGSAKARISPERTAHLLTSAVRGFKQTASKPAELRRLIKELLSLSLS